MSRTSIYQRDLIIYSANAHYHWQVNQRNILTGVVILARASGKRYRRLSPSLLRDAQRALLS